MSVFARHGIDFKNTAHAAEHDRSDATPRRLVWLDRSFEIPPAIPIAEQLTLALAGLGQPPVTAEQRASIQVLAVRRAEAL